jgi:hypothetical protein
MTNYNGRSAKHSGIHRPRITTQKELRAEFWETHPECVRRPGSQNSQPTDTRITFVDWIDMLARDGDISEALANRATL